LRIRLRSRRPPNVASCWRRACFFVLISTRRLGCGSTSWSATTSGFGVFDQPCGLGHRSCRFDSCDSRLSSTGGEGCSTAERWPEEDARVAPKPVFSIGSLNVDGWSIGTLGVTNRLGVGLWLQKVQVIEPNDLQIAPQISIKDSSPDLANGGDHIDLHQVIPPPTPNSTQTFGIWSGSFYAKPAKDGEVITLQFELRDPDYPRTWRIDVSSTVHKQQ
jgi:hypothetical protein